MHYKIIHIYIFRNEGEGIPNKIKDIIRNEGEGVPNKIKDWIPQYKIVISLPRLSPL